MHLRMCTGAQYPPHQSCTACAGRGALAAYTIETQASDLMVEPAPCFRKLVKWDGLRDLDAGTQCAECTHPRLCRRCSVARGRRALFVGLNNSGGGETVSLPQPPADTSWRLAADSGASADHAPAGWGSVAGIASVCRCSWCSWSLVGQLPSFRTCSARPPPITHPSRVAGVPGALVTCTHVSGAACALQGVPRRTTFQMALGSLWAVVTTTCRRAYTIQFLSPMTVNSNRIPVMVKTLQLVPAHVILVGMTCGSPLIPALCEKAWHVALTCRRAVIK